MNILHITIKKITATLLFIMLLDTGAFCQNNNDIYLKGEWTGVLTLQDSYAYDTEFTLDDYKEKKDAYTGKATFRIREKSPLARKKLVFALLVYFEEGKLIFEMHNRCILRAETRYQNFADTVFALDGRYHPVDCLAGSFGTIWMRRKFTETETAILKRRAIVQDSIYMAKYGDKKLKYINCKEAAELVTKNNIRNCNDYVFYNQYNTVSFNKIEPFTYNASYYSVETNFIPSSAYSADNRLIGSWRTEDSRTIYQFRATGNTSTPIAMKVFNFYDREGKYFESGRADVLGSEDVHATMIGNLYFLENINPVAVNNKAQYQRYLSRYQFNDDTHVSFYPISAEYTSINQQFSSTEEYRTYVESNMKKDGFFIPPVKLIKYTATNNLPQTREDKARQEAQIGILIVSGLISMALEGGCTSCNGSGKYGIEHGAGMNGMTCSRCNGTGK